MIQEDFQFLSADKKTTIHGMKWLPDRECTKAVLQITHGMQEYIGRYTEFAQFLAGKGIAAVGHDRRFRSVAVGVRVFYGQPSQRHADQRHAYGQKADTKRI